MNLDTITAPIAVNNESTTIYNLYITLDAIVNPVKDTIFSPYDVDGILKRSRSRIAAKVIEVVISRPLENINELNDLRVRIVEAAQKSFDEIYSNWKHAEAFEVEIVITSMSLSQPLPLSRSSRFW
jgi:hypothetical protein